MLLFWKWKAKQTKQSTCQKTSCLTPRVIETHGGFAKTYMVTWCLLALKLKPVQKTKKQTKLIFFFFYHCTNVLILWSCIYILHLKPLAVSPGPSPILSTAVYLTSSKKISNHLQAVLAVREPTQGVWKVLLKDVVVMATELGFMKRKGMHSHCGQIKRSSTLALWLQHGRAVLLFFVDHDGRDLHRGDENEGELDDVSVRHWVEPTKQGVGDGHTCWDPDTHAVGQIQDDTHGHTWKKQIPLSPRQDRDPYKVVPRPVPRRRPISTIITLALADKYHQLLVTG